MAPTTALLVIDMQIFFESMTRAVLPNIQKLISHFESSSTSSHSPSSSSTSRVPMIIYTQHGHSREELTTVPSPNQIVRKWGPDQCIAYGSADWELQDAIKEHIGRGLHSHSQGQNSGNQTAERGNTTDLGTKPKAIVLPKNTYDAFINTPLASILRDNGVARLVVCGVMTDCCCDTTARSAFNRGYETWLVRDACATVDESQHEAALKGYGYGYGPVLTTEEALVALKC